MADTGHLIIEVSRNICVKLDDGGDITPAGNKERGVLLMLAASEERSCTRKLLKETLWSDRFEEQAQHSLRRALSNIRKSMGSVSSSLKADRRNVWLDASLKVEWKQGVRSEDLLSDLKIADRAFSGWLSNFRARVSRPDITSLNEARTLELVEKPVVCQVTFVGELTDRFEKFAVRELSSFFAHHAGSMGNVAVRLRDEDDLGEEFPADAEYVVDICTSRQREAVNLIARLGTSHDGTYLFSKTLALDEDSSQQTQRTNLSTVAFELANTIMSQNQAMAGGDHSALAMHRAAVDLFSGSAPKIQQASQVLKLAARGQHKGIGIAWQSYAALTRSLELQTLGYADLEQAIELAWEAVGIAPHNPVVLTLASQVQMKLAKDMDYARFLASAAMSENENNPFSLFAMSHTGIYFGELETAYRFAHRGAFIGRRFPGSFIWDMQTCLTAMSLGRFDDAYQMAHRAHMKSRNYRPTLRYLVLLALFQADLASAALYCGRLRLLEEGFVPTDFLRPDYPIDTFRWLNLLDRVQGDVLRLQSVFDPN